MELQSQIIVAKLLFFAIIFKFWIKSVDFDFHTKPSHKKPEFLVDLFALGYLIYLITWEFVIFGLIFA